MGEKDFKKKFEEWKESYRRTSLVIARIPEKTKTEFIRWCEKELCKDYGMGLKWLFDHYKGTLPNENEEINAKIELLANEVDKIRDELKEKKEEKVLRAADGRMVRKGIEKEA